MFYIWQVLMPSLEKVELIIFVYLGYLLYFCNSLRL